MKRALYGAIWLAGCASEIAPAVPVEVTQARWTSARAELAEMRQGRPERPYAERVRLGVTDPRNGKTIQARGALAVSPHHAARLVLVGPGGSTAVDAWVTPDRYRVSIPAMQIEKRGEKDASGALGLPIGFLRWWFLAPLEGELLTLDHETLILGDGESTFRVQRWPERGRLLAVRRAHGDVDGIEWFARDLMPAAGQHGHYVDRDHHVDVQITIEAVMTEEPDPAAFIDPDEPQGQAL